MNGRDAKVVDGRVMAPKPGYSWLEIGALVFLLSPIAAAAAWMIYSLLKGAL